MDPAIFAPPPVPAFMLRPPERPLSLEEMRRQADEAARAARPGKGETEKAPP